MKRSAVLQIVDDIKNQLIEKYKPEKIILFGSFAWGGEDINDLDFFVVKKNVPYYGADRVIELYHTINFDAPVDFIIYTPEEVEERLSLGDPFVKKIYKEGQVLYG